MNRDPPNRMDKLNTVKERNHDFYVISRYFRYMFFLFGIVLFLINVKFYFLPVKVSVSIFSNTTSFTNLVEENVLKTWESTILWQLATPYRLIEKKWKILDYNDRVFYYRFNQLNLL